MNTLELCEVQATLDERIRKEKNILLEPQALFKNTLVALDIELAEFANDARWFKVWSHNQDPKETTLEEFVDSVHFFLSIANLKGWQNVLVFEERTLNSNYDGDLSQLNENYLEMKHQLARVFFMESKLSFGAAWMNFLILGMSGFGFTWEQINEAYLSKNKINHQRQETGY